MLTDNWRQYFGRPLHHPFELYCAVQQVEHRTTRVGSPESNGMVERFNRTLKEEFFSVAYRTRPYDSVEAPQTDLDGFLSFYNERRAHHGYRTQGRTPLQMFGHLNPSDFVIHRNGQRTEVTLATNCIRTGPTSRPVRVAINTSVRSATGHTRTPASRPASFKIRS